MSWLQNTTYLRRKNSGSKILWKMGLKMEHEEAYKLMLCWPIKTLELRARMPPTDPVEGFWGKPTATIDWCEKNYEVSYYVAEWWNTITNLSYILPAVWGFYEVYRNGYKKRIYVLYFLLFLIGVGSWMFHMTLQYSYQLLDELPMVYFSLFNIYCLLVVPNTSNKTFFSNQPLFMFLFGFSILFKLIYLLWPEPLFHEFVFGALIFWGWFLEGRIIYLKRCKTCKRLMIADIASLVIAFILWNIDTIFCSALEDIRRTSVTGLGPFTQLHGWWHIITGYSALSHILFAIHSWYDFHKEEEGKLKLEIAHAGLSLRWG